MDVGIVVLPDEGEGGAACFTASGWRFSVYGPMVERRLTWPAGGLIPVLVIDSHGFQAWPGA